MVLKNTSVNNISIEDYNYNLPNENIAQQALQERDTSKFLVYENNEIKHHIFNEIAELLPENSCLFLNDAKVIPARLKVQKNTGAWIEIFLLQPSNTDYFTSLNTTSQTQWQCLIGNKKKWKEDEILQSEFSIQNTSIIFQLTWVNYEQNIVKFTWQTGHLFLDIIETMGAMPLPPYIKRQAEENDKQRYQTVYSKTAGAVAAPTAGLHFTANVFQQLIEKNIDTHYLTLHVSAGTFLPITVQKAAEHPMHQEFFSVNINTINALQNCPYPVAVGTTSVRVLESLYWCAVNILNNKKNPFEIEQLQAYETYKELPTSNKALQILKNYLTENNLETLSGNTCIMIMPSYEFKFIKGLITNFHQPKSTLMLLIAALVGDNWKNIYQGALENNYRFLSYGDSSLLLS